MTTGAPIYLVSACTSGEEFVAAFRRYADRNGVVFVPIADPLPAGKKGRFALTLTDGGVMVEGEAEVVSAARTPSVLYGRVGMTLKFLVPDEPSKTTLGELEKARLALKPTPPTIAPRPANVPAEPRPKLPAATGRIDHVNALAECVAIGAGVTHDLGELPPKNANQKFVVPSVPSLPPGRSRPVSKPPPTPTSLGAAALQQTMSGTSPGGDLTKPAKEDLSTTMRGTKPAAATMPRNPPPASTPPPVPPPRPPTPAVALPVVKPPRMATPYAPMPIVQQPAPPIVAPTKPREPEVELSEPTDLTGIPQVDDDLVPDAVADSTVPVAIPHEHGSAPLPMVAANRAEQTGKTGREGRKTVMGVAVVPSGVMVLPAAPALRRPSEDETRDTSVMTVQTPTSQITGRTDADNVVALSPTLRPTEPLRPSAVRANIEEPTPSGDWTMTPGVNGPTIIPTPRDKLARAGTAPAPQGPQTGDWMIALDPSQPDGWGEPSKVEKRPAGELPPGPPVSVVSSARPLDSNRRLGTEPAIVDSDVDKVQIDPTLIGPHVAMPNLDDQTDEPSLPPPPSTAHSVVGEDGLMPTPTSLSSDSQAHYEAPPMPGAMASHVRGSIPNNVFTPPAGLPYLAAASGSNPVFGAPSQAFEAPRVVTDAGSGFFRESGDIPSYASGPTPTTSDAAGRKRLIVIIASAVGVAILGIILLLALGGGDDKKATVDTTENTVPATPPDKTTAIVAPTATIDAASEVPVVVDAAEAVKVTPDPAPPESAVDCKVSVSSAPSGAEIVIGKAVVGTTPTALTLPCGEEAKLVVRKARFVTTTRAVTPKVGAKPIKVSLARVTFSVKVSSTPPGASITVAGKPMGFTPTTVKLPAFEASTLKIAKDGFTSDAQKITPKQNNQTVHATLKRTAKRR